MVLRFVISNGVAVLSENKIDANFKNAVIRAVFSCPGSKLDNIIADLVLDGNRRWLHSVPAAGWWGKENSDDVWPFILKKGGVLDFGNNIKEPTPSNERFGSFEISDRPLLIGESFHFAYCDISANYKLVRDDDLTMLGCD